MANALAGAGAIPEQAVVDATHIAIATAHGVEYLLTWNCTHIVNATMRSSIESICRSAGYEPDAKARRVKGSNKARPARKGRAAHRHAVEAARTDR